MEPLLTALRGALKDKRLNQINSLNILTDRLDYKAIDQVFPLFAEQQFFLDELVADKLRDAEVLEVGLGSGVLSIGALHAGARQVTALEINPRAKAFAGFNCVLNGVEGRVSVLDGHPKIFPPLQGRRFDYILSNPPFEPTPPGMNYFYHSAAGPYGLDFLDTLLPGVEAHLKDSGHAQFVTVAPGDAQQPTLLLELIRKHLPGSSRVVINPEAMTFDEVMDRLEDKKMGPSALVEGLRRRAREDGVTHMYLCVIHYEKGARQLQVERSRKVYPQFWDVPAPELTF